jgi:hypothetical protein
MLANAFLVDTRKPRGNNGVACVHQFHILLMSPMWYDFVPNFVVSCSMLWKNMVLIS